MPIAALAFAGALLLASVPGPDLGLPVRVLLAVTGIVALLNVRSVSRSILLWGTALAGYLAMMALVAGFSAAPSLAIADFVRQAFLAGTAFALTLALQDPKARRWFIRALLVITLLHAGALLGAYAAYAGESGVAIVIGDSEFKRFTAERFGLEANPIAFHLALTLLMSIPWLIEKRAIGAVVVVATVIALVLAGSRTTLVSLVLAGPVGMALYVAMTQRRVGRAWGYAALIVAVGSPVAVMVVAMLGGLLDPVLISDATTGRLDLWVVAWGDFLRYPLTGVGADRFTTTLAANLPGFVTFDESLITLRSGGAHNAFLTLLAERGLIVSGFAALLVASVLHVAAKALRSPGEQFRSDVVVSRVAPFALAFMLLHTIAEQAGLFGDANSAGDLAAYALTAIVIAVASDLQGPTPGD